jgi:hypothetical protein
MTETTKAIKAVVETMVKWFAGNCHNGSIGASSEFINGGMRRAA